MTEKTNINERHKIRVSEILDITKRLQEINSLELTEIDFLDDNGNAIEIDKKIIEDFKFCGLNNSVFIASEFYLSGFDS